MVCFFLIRLVLFLLCVPIPLITADKERSRGEEVRALSVQLPADLQGHVAADCLSKAVLVSRTELSQRRPLVHQPFSRIQLWMTWCLGVAVVL